MPSSIPHLRPTSLLTLILLTVISPISTFQSILTTWNKPNVPSSPFEPWTPSLHPHDSLTIPPHSYLKLTRPSMTHSPTQRPISYLHATHNHKDIIDAQFNVTQHSSSPTPSVRSLDTILSKATSYFPLYVAICTLLGFTHPHTLAWLPTTADGSLLTILLALVMTGTGMTLSMSDFTNVWFHHKHLIPLGVLCQYTIMPLTAMLIGKYILQGSPALYLGLILVGCSPGGTASNLVALIANADAALSVVLTACSTFLASLITPFLVQSIVPYAIFSVNARILRIAVWKVVLVPVTMGMVSHRTFPNLSSQLSRFVPFVSALVVALICGSIVALNAQEVGSLLVSSSQMRRLLMSIVSLHSIGFALGYFIPRGLKCTKKSSRTISIETGMQNSALAVVLAREICGDQMACLPGAVSATVHCWIGSLLAGYWKSRRGERSEQ